MQGDKTNLPNVRCAIKMEWLFSATGILAMVVCPFFLRSKVLKEEKESANVQELQLECTV